MKFDIPIIVLVISAMWAFIQWLSKRHIDFSKSDRESLALISELFKEDLKDMSPQRKLLAEEALSGYYKSNIYINEIILLIGANSPKSAIETYLKYKRFLTIEDGKVRYKKNPFTKIPFTKFNFPTMVIKGVLIYVTFASFGINIISASIPELRSIEIGALNADKAPLIISVISEVSLIFVGITCIIVAIVFLFDSFVIPSKTVLKTGLKGIFDGP